MSVTLDEAVERYLNRTTIRPATREAYSQRLKLMMEHVGSSKRISDVHPFDLLRFIEDVSERDSLNSDVTYNNYVKNVSLFFNWCVKKAKLLDESPADILEYRQIDTGGEGWQPMSEENYKKLLEYVGTPGRGYRPREHALVTFLADTGIRCASAAAMVWDDLDLKNQSALITHQKSRSAHAHVVSWGRDCQIALTKWYLAQSRKGGRYIFSHNGQSITTRSLNKFFRRLTEKAGIGAHGTHSLRNRFGIRATRQFGIVHAAKLMNTSETIVARHYVKESEESLLDMMRQLANHNRYTFKMPDKVGTNEA